MGMLCCGFSIAHTPGVVTPVNIFGDGDPANGIEDNRQQMLGGSSDGGSLSDQQMNAGTIECDGKIRGTAMVIDTREFAPNLKGVVLASAAHVLFDLERKRRFRRCKFHFLALDELARYGVKIDLGKLKLGGFDPRTPVSGPEFGRGDWAFLYVPRVWKGFKEDEALKVRSFVFADMDSFRQSGGELRLVAYDSSADVISVSKDCNVFESVNGDLGGGTWKGQLLDDCDSRGGASGGGILAVFEGHQFLVGIRNGSHWSETDFPSAEFPLGPPDGSVWNRSSNTNFGRAIDAQLIRELEIFSRNIEADSAW